MTDKERIEVYVNELPENCKECRFNSMFICVLNDKGVLQNAVEKTTNLYCPLKTIQSVQNQKAVEALEKAWNKIINISDIVVKTLPNNYDCLYIRQKKMQEIFENLIKDYGGKE